MKIQQAGVSLNPESVGIIVYVLGARASFIRDIYGRVNGQDAAGSTKHDR